MGIGNIITFNACKQAQYLTAGDNVLEVVVVLSLAAAGKEVALSSRRARDMVWWGQLGGQYLEGDFVCVSDALLCLPDHIVSMTCAYLSSLVDRRINAVRQGGCSSTYFHLGVAGESL
jgi:hypothetical protein